MFRTPRHVCETCGEYLPHYCTPPRRKRKPPGPTAADLAARIDAAAGTGTVSRYLLDICEAVEGPDPNWVRECDEWDGAA